MRYSAIGVFSDGSFFDPTWNYSTSTENIVLHGLNTDKLKEYLKEHKYVIATLSSEDTGITCVLFREEHPMFNLPVLRKKTYLKNGLMYGPIHGILKELLTNFNNNTI